MPKDNKFVFHNDGGHGWLAVKRKLIEALGIENEISIFSYQKGQSVYLEEDQDLGTFCKIMEDLEIEIKTRSSYKDNSHVRYFDRYQRPHTEPLKSEIVDVGGYKVTVVRVDR